MSFEERLELNGFTREIAGEEDFGMAVNAFKSALSSPRLGIIAAGDYGVGKTCFIRAVASALSDSAYWIGLSDSSAIAEFDDKFIDYNATHLYERHVVLDDLGAERTMNQYGIRIESAGDFILNYHVRSERRLFITTNLTAGEIDGRYGGRVLSRLKDLCVPIRFNGKDKRKWTL